MHASIILTYLQTFQHTLSIQSKSKGYDMEKKPPKISWVKMDEEQHATIKAAAKEMGVPISTYLRLAGLRAAKAEQ